MAGAIIVADQPSGAGSGSPGVARNDLWLAQVVDLSCATSGNVSFQWDLLAAPTGSAASLSTPTASTSSFTPDIVGTYRIRLVTNGGGPGNVQILVFRVRYSSTGSLSGRGWALPAFGELATESNYGGNAVGWAEPLTFIFADILSNAFSGGGGSGVVAPTPSTLAERGTSGEVYAAFFAPVQASIAASGILRLTSSAQSAVSALSQVNPSNTISLLSQDGADSLVLGDATNGVSTTIKCAGSTAGSLFFQLHSSFGASLFGDATNGIAIGSGGGPLQILTKRALVGAGSQWSQLVITPRAFSPSSSIVLNFDAFGSHPDLTLTSDCSLGAPANVIAGGRYTVTFRQSGGPWTVTWDAHFIFGNIPNALRGSSFIDVFEFVGDTGGNLRCIAATTMVSAGGTNDKVGNTATHVWNLSEPAGSTSFADTGTGTTFVLTPINTVTAGRTGIFSGAVDGSVAANGGSGGSLTGGTPGETYNPAFPVTIAIWFYKYTNPGSKFLFGRLANEFTIYDNSGTLQAQTSMVTFTSSYPPIQLGVWNLAVLTYDGANVKLYLNGDLIDSSAQTAAISYNPSFSWGVGYSGGVFEGKMTKAVIDETAWTAAKVASVYQAGVSHF